MSPSEKLQKAEDLITDAMNEMVLKETRATVHLCTNYASSIHGVGNMIRVAQEAGQ